jgi:hypothetical protein
MKPKTWNSTKTNLWVDIAIFVAIMLALAPLLTGIAIHEWLSIALAVAVVVHLLLHWQWIVAVIGRFFSRLPGEARLNFFLNVALFICFTVVTFTGLMISESALPLFGIPASRDFVWRALHSLSANLTVLTLGLHVALHWKWIFSAARRYLLNPILSLGGKTKHQPRPAPVPAMVRQEVES